MRAIRLLLLGALVTVIPVFRAEASRPPDTAGLHAASLGPIVEAPDGRSEMELLKFDERVTAALQALAPEESARIEDWPVSPGRRAHVVLRRFDIYAPDAKIVVIENGVEHEVPRSSHVYFRGTVEDGLEAGSSVVGWLNPETGVLGGFAMTSRGTFVLAPPETGHERIRLTLGQALDPVGAAPSWNCSVPDDEESPFWNEVQKYRALRPASLSGRNGGVSALGTWSKTAVIAIDTDVEYLSRRFSDNTTTAATYIGDLVAGMSAIYERDVASVQGNGVKILQGYTILRVGAAGSDPYNQPDGQVSQAKIDEFGAYWDAHYPTTVVRRSLAALLSGKEGFPNSASGLAWVGSLCAGSTYGYSVDQLFTGAYGVTADLGILAHEVGHNFGAFHTHSCYYGNPPIDRCVAPEGGCTTASGCPGPLVFNGLTTNGTLMSYCHTIGCSPRALVFHTRSITDNPADPYGVDSVLTEVANATCLNTLFGGVVPSGPNSIAISPLSGPLAGGQSVTITGGGFGTGTIVSFVELPSNNVFGGSPDAKVLGNISVLNANTITATTPSATNTGLVDVVVMNADQQTATIRNGYTYSTGPAAPSVTAVNPNFGTTAGGTAVTITGSSFVATPTVTIGGTAATGVTFVSSTTLRATTPAHAAGTVNVVVTNPDLQAGTLTSGYFFAPAPTATTWYPLTPCRILDTRLADGPLGGPVLSANQTRTFDVTTIPMTCGIPATAKSLTVNFTAVSPTQAGELRAYPGNGVPTVANVVGFRAGEIRCNNNHLTLSTDGTGTFNVRNASSGTVHVIVDVNGYYQ